VTANVAKPRLYAVVLGGFSVVRVMIAAVGLVGGYRMPCSAIARDVGCGPPSAPGPATSCGWCWRHAVLTLAAGLTAGVWLAFAASRYLSTVLYGVAPHDVASFVALR